jgi:hypothetical protein
LDAANHQAMEVTEIGLLDAAISRRPMLSFLSAELCLYHSLSADQIRQPISWWWVAKKQV